LYLPSRFHRRPPRAWPGKVRALGTTAVHLAQVASGAGRATVIPRWAPWDVACGLLLVEEAGRVVTDMSARPATPLRDPVPLPFVAGDETAVSFIAELIRSSPEP
jgi:fructose-1,6-bisphosphatase/inositol monophosphatase family enzyme